jgi:malonyl-CoA O-methyltransferase
MKPAPKPGVRTSIIPAWNTDLFRFLRRFRAQSRPTVLSSLDAYAHWASRYPPYAHNPLMQQEEAIMRRLLPDLYRKRVLDLACGTGRYGLIARERGAEQVFGCDNSPHMLAANPLTALFLSSTEAIPLPDQSIDLLLCGLALGHLPELTPSMREIGRVLQAGGLALISDFHPAMFASGGQRTFHDASGSVRAVEHYPHPRKDYQTAAEAARLIVETVEEAAVPGAPNTAPAVIVYAMRKPA